MNRYRATITLEEGVDRSAVANELNEKMDTDVCFPPNITKFIVYLDATSPVKAKLALSDLLEPIESLPPAFVKEAKITVIMEKKE